MFFRYRKRAIYRMDDCYWNCESTQYLWKKRWLQVLVSKKHSTHGNIRSLQVVSWNNDSTTEMDGCKCFFEITVCLKLKYLPNTLYTWNPWLQVLFYKNTVSIEEWWPQLLSWNKERMYSEKKLFPAFKHSNLQGKIVFLGTTILDHSLFSCTDISLWSVGNCSSMLFQRLYVDRVGPRKHLLVQSQQQKH